MQETDLCIVLDLLLQQFAFNQSTQWHTMSSLAKSPQAPQWVRTGQSDPITVLAGDTKRED